MRRVRHFLLRLAPEIRWIQWWMCRNSRLDSPVQWLSVACKLPLADFLSYPVPKPFHVRPCTVTSNCHPLFSACPLLLCELAICRPLEEYWEKYHNNIVFFKNMRFECECLLFFVQFIPVIVDVCRNWHCASKGRHFHRQLHRALVFWGFVERLLWLVIDKQPCKTFRFIFYFLSIECFIKIEFFLYYILTLDCIWSCETPLNFCKLCLVSVELDLRRAIVFWACSLPSTRPSRR